MKKKVAAKYLITAGLFIGIGVGMIINQVAAGALIGLGIGYIAAYLEDNRK
tara:strand:- start:947 stop:1099 length:153 start_codon:yes stop_codon:yes gene_type:complete